MAEKAIYVSTLFDGYTCVYCEGCANKFYPESEDHVEWTPADALMSPSVDSPEMCNHCGALLDVPLTDDGLEYVAEQITEELAKYGCLQDLLTEWHDFYGDEVKRHIQRESHRDIDDILYSGGVENAYMAAQLWTAHIDFMSTTDEFGGEPVETGQLDRVVSSCHELPEQLWVSGREEVANFVKQVEDFIGYWELPGNFEDEQIGHDLSLTRNGHGAGFWDRGWNGLGEYLSDVARSYSDHYLMASVIVNDPAAPDVTDFDNLLMDTLQITEGC